MYEQKDIDVVVHDQKKFYLVEFLSARANAWAREHLNKRTSSWIDGKLVLEKQFENHFEFVMFDADLEFAEAVEEVQ